jgi:hypothetical protein
MGLCIGYDARQINAHLSEADPDMTPKARAPSLDPPRGARPASEPHLRMRKRRMKDLKKWKSRKVSL